MPSADEPPLPVSARRRRSLVSKYAPADAEATLRSAAARCISRFVRRAADYGAGRVEKVPDMFRVVKQLVAARRKAAVATAVREAAAERSRLVQERLHSLMRNDSGSGRMRLQPREGGAGGGGGGGADGREVRAATGRPRPKPKPKGGTKSHFRNKKKSPLAAGSHHRLSSPTGAAVAGAPAAAVAVAPAPAPASAAAEKIPAPWERVDAGGGKHYFWNSKSGETRWTLPDPLSAFA